jgi:hypothetical protein
MLQKYYQKWGFFVSTKRPGKDVEHRSRTGRSWAPRAGTFTTVSACAAATAAAISLADTISRRASRKPSTF